MSSWPVASLGDVVQINPRVGTERASADLPVSFVPMAAVCEHTGSIVSSDVRPFGQVSKGFPIFAENDVLFAKITPCMENGKAAIARNLENGTGAGSTEFFVLRPTDRILSEYVFHFIRRTSFRAACKANFTGSAGQQRVPKSFLEKVAIPLPPLDEQRRIVGVLDRAAEIRRRADAARAKARAIIPALFLDTFGDPAANPKRWKSSALTDLCDLVRGSSPRPQGDSRFFGGPVPRLMISDISRDGTYVTPRTDSLTIEGAARSRPMNAGDVVMAVSGAVGLPAILAVSACIHDGFVGFRNLHSEVTAQFFYYYLLAVRRLSQRQAVGATFQNLNTDQIRRWIVPIPPEQYQTAFTATAHRVESLARHLDAAAVKAEAMAVGLSAEVFGSRQPDQDTKHSPAHAATDLSSQVLISMPRLEVRA